MSVFSSFFFILFVARLLGWLVGVRVSVITFMHSTTCEFNAMRLSAHTQCSPIFSQSTNFAHTHSVACRLFACRRAHKTQLCVCVRYYTRFFAVQRARSSCKEMNNDRAPGAQKSKGAHAAAATTAPAAMSESTGANKLQQQQQQQLKPSHKLMLCVWRLNSALLLLLVIIARLLLLLRLFLPLLVVGCWLSSGEHLKQLTWWPAISLCVRSLQPRSEEFFLSASLCSFWFG